MDVFVQVQTYMQGRETFLVSFPASGNKRGKKYIESGGLCSVAASHVYVI